jgi:hypothetical protein
MRKKSLTSIALAMLIAVPGLCADQMGSAFSGQDFHASAGSMTRFETPEKRQLLVLEESVKLVFGTYALSAEKAVVWLDTVKTEYRGTYVIRYSATVYLSGDVSVRRDSGVKTTQLSETAVADQDALVARFDVTGRVFTTAATTRQADPRDMKVYKDALTAMQQARVKPSSGAYDTDLLESVSLSRKRPSLAQSLFGMATEPNESQVQPYRYPVNISGVGESLPRVEYAKGPEGGKVATIIGRFYLWQKTDEKDNLLELQADNAVVFFKSQPEDVNKPATADIKTLSGRSDIEAIYLGGNIVLTEGLRTIRCDEMYYDFFQKSAVAINAEMKTFDPQRGIPIYLRAQKVRQVAENRFSASDITLTTSEFYKPQLSLTASKIIVTDTANIDSQADRLNKNSYQGQIENVRARYYGVPFFAWPKMNVNMERPDVPIKSVHISHDSTWGTSVETRWYLSRLLGLKQPEGTDNTFLLDYFGKRGVGTGVDINYRTDEYFGRLLAYIVDDHGEDNLGSENNRQGIKPDKQVRGRLAFQHRQYLDDDWQLTTELSYLSDRHFLESYNPGEFNNGKEQETLIYAKRLRDNWAYSLLAKWRINDFQNQLEELPSAEYHLTGQSLMDSTFTFYSDNEASSLRQKIDTESALGVPNERFAFGVTRNEIDMPLSAGEWKIVPFAAGTGGYDDRSGFYTPYAAGESLARPERDSIGIGEVGLRAAGEYWRLYPEVESRLWDLNGLRHIVRPEISATTYQETDDVFDQHDLVRIGLSQILQTKRGPAGSQRTVDWMTLNTEFIIVDDAAAVAGAPTRYVWNNPATPLRTVAVPGVFNSDISSARTIEEYGPARTHMAGDYTWRMTDTTALLSDAYYDTENGQIEQYNLGFTHTRYPDLSYYLGTRYLKNVEVLDEKGSNSVIWAVTYMLDPRYTVIYAQQYDFDYGTNITSEVTILRKYHRAYCGLTFNVDESLDRRSIMFSIWPEGVKELAFGSRRYTSLSGMSGK